MEQTPVILAAMYSDIKPQKCRDLQNRVRGPSRSLDMSPFDTAHKMTSYLRSTVIMFYSKYYYYYFYTRKP